MKLPEWNKILTFIVICSILMIAVVTSAVLKQDENSIDSSEIAGQKTEKYVPGEIIVKFKPGLSDKDVSNINPGYETSVLYTSPYAGFKTLKIPKTKTVEEMVEIYSKNPNVEYAVPNYLMYATMVPNDPYYTGELNNQWNFKDGNGINVEPAWDISIGSDVVVAVLDTGVADNSPDLDYTNFISGYDFVNGDSNPVDDQGHGTHVTGTIAESTNNGIGATGVAYGCTIMPVKVLDSSGSGTLSQLVDGIYYASNNGAQVISMSLGFPPSVTAKKLAPLFPALDYAYSKGIVIVAAAGNDALSNIGYPAAYDKCIAVGATRYDGTRSYYSNYGTALDIMAPGGDTNVDQNADGKVDGICQNTVNPITKEIRYALFQGTSMATPHVSGVAALLIADGVTGPENVRKAIQSTAQDKGASGWDPEYGWGIVNAYAALKDVSVPQPTGELHITAVNMDYSTRTAGKNTLVTAKATVTIVDTTTNSGIGGATVSGQWSGAATDSDTGVTDSSGKVTLSSNEVKVPSTATFKFTVNDVSYAIPWDELPASGTITYTK